jgi:hypothetical protein
MSQGDDTVSLKYIFEVNAMLTRISSGFEACRNREFGKNCLKKW